MEKQQSIDEKMRAILIDWMVDVSQKFKLKPQCLFIATSLLDRYLQRVVIDRSRLQLVGIVAMMIAAKFEEIYPPPLPDYLTVCNGNYSERELIQTEADLLNCISFEIAVPVSYVLLEFINFFVKLSPRAFHLCHYLLESCLLDLRQSNFAPHELAAGVLFLVRKSLKLGSWGPREEKLTQVTSSRAKTVCREIFQIMQNLSGKDLTAIKSKFSSPKYEEVSKFKIEKISNDPPKPTSADQKVAVDS